MNRSGFRGRRDNSTILGFNYCIEDRPDIETTTDAGNDGSNGSEDTVDTVTEDTENGYDEGLIKSYLFAQ